MAPIPPILIRLATVFLTQALTRRLQQSPLFFRAVDRLIHEIDHLPHRINGKAVPYRRRDPHEPTITEMAQDAWKNQVDDPGEPHDMTDPFANPASSTSTKPKLLERTGRSEAPPRRARNAGFNASQGGKKVEKRDDMQEMRSILERLREGKEG